MQYQRYNLLQDYVHQGHRWQRGVLSREWASHAQSSVLSAGPQCLELACGGGNLADVFPADHYLGIDLMSDRVAEAQRAHPTYRFEVADVTRPDFEGTLAGIDFVFCHGLLHHLDDNACANLLGKLRANLAKPATFVSIEPLLPRPWRNPPGYLLCKADDGHFIRPS